MIEVTRLNNEKYYINAEMIMYIEAVPNTVLTTTEGIKLVVKETPEEIVDKIIAYKRKIYIGAPEDILKTKDD